MREREREQPREREKHRVSERPSERGRLREKQKGRGPGGERERGRDRKRSLPIAKESHRGRRAEKRRERSRTTVTKRGRWRNVIRKEELHGGHGARNNDLVENEKWTTVVSRRSLKASQHLSSTGGQPELGGRDTRYERNWRNQADITSYYFTHFPDEANEELLWWHFKKWGDVREVYIAKRLNKEGRRYGFVRYKDVRDARGLELRLDNIVINGCKLFANLPRFERSRRKTELQEYKYAGGKKTTEGSKVGVTNTDHPRKSYVDAVVKGGCLGPTKEDEVRKPIIQIKPPESGGVWCEGTWTGKLKKMTEIETLEDRIAWELGYNVGTKFLGDDMVLLHGLTDDQARSIIKSEMERGDSLFYEMKKWSPSSRPTNRVVWLQLWGFPIQVWGMQSFRTAMAEIGDVIEPDDDTEDRRRLDRARVLVRTPLPPPIRSDIIVCVGKLEYKVCIVEEVGPEGGMTKRSSSPSEGWSDMITSEDDGDGGDVVDDTDTNFSFSPELSNRNAFPAGNLWTHRQTDGRSIDGGLTGNIQPNVNLQQKSKTSAEAMVDPTTGKDSLGEGPTVTQKEEVYTKRDTANNNQQNDYRHRHHPQGKYSNGEGKDPEEQASIGEEEITAIQYPYPLPLEQNGPNYSKGPLEVKDGCNKEYSVSADHLGMNEGQHHKGGGLSNNTGPLLTEEGCHKEKPRHEAQPLKVCSDKFCKVYSRQKTSSLSRDRIPHMEAQEPSPPHRSFSSAEPNDTQTRNQKQNPVPSEGRLKSEIQCSDEMMLEAQQLCTLGKELGMETDLDVLHKYASMERRDREEARKRGNRIWPQ